MKFYNVFGEIMDSKIKLEKINGQKVIIKYTKHDVLSEIEFIDLVSKYVRVPNVISYNDETNPHIVLEYISGLIHFSKRPLDLFSIGKMVARIHSINTNGFGPRTSYKTGIYNTFNEFLQYKINYLKQKVDSNLIHILESRIISKVYTGNSVLTHNDLYSNIFYGEKNLVLIDPHTFVYTCILEWDIAQFSSDFLAHNKNYILIDFFKGYGKKLNPENFNLCFWINSLIKINVYRNKYDLRKNYENLFLLEQPYNLIFNNN